MGSHVSTGDGRASVSPYPIVIGDSPSNPGSYVLVHAEKRDKTARRWIAAAGALHKDIPIRFEGDPEEARVVVSMSSASSSGPSASPRRWRPAGR